MKKKDRSIRKRNKRHSKKSSTLKKMNKKSKRKSKMNRKNNKRKTITKRQKGGSLLGAIGIGLAATAVTAAAYKGYRMVSKLNDKGYMFRLLNQDYISYSPKVVVVETPDFMKHYLECVSTVEFFQLLLSNREYLKSKTLQGLIKQSANNEKESKSKLEEKYGEEYKELEQLLDYNESKKDILQNLELETTTLELESQDENVKKLRDLLLLTAKIPGSSLDSNAIDDTSEFQELNKLDRINPYLTVSTFRWQEVVYSGIYDEYFTSEVNEILKERNSEFLLIEPEKTRIQGIIMNLSNNPKFIEGIRAKMVECSSKPRGYLDYVSSKISWDSQKACLACPSQDCLLYVYDFYQGLLQQDDDILMIDKLYALMVCEARICVLSKCLALEAIRIQDGNTGRVKSLIHQIYLKDMKSPTGRSLELPNQIIPFQKQSGGSAPETSSNDNTGGQPNTGSTTSPAITNESTGSTASATFTSGKEPTPTPTPSATTTPESGQTTQELGKTSESVTATPGSSTATPESGQTTQEPGKTPESATTTPGKEPTPSESATTTPETGQTTQEPGKTSGSATTTSGKEPPSPSSESATTTHVSSTATSETEKGLPVSSNPETKDEESKGFFKSLFTKSDSQKEPEQKTETEPTPQKDEIKEDKQMVKLSDPIMDTYMVSMESELEKEIPLHKSKFELFRILDVDEKEPSDAVKKFMEFKIGTNVTLKDIFINVFRDYSSSGETSEEKIMAIQALFNLIKEYGMIFVDCFSLEFLLSAGNLFSEDISQTDVIGLSDKVYQLFKEGKDKTAMLIIIVLLRFSDNPNQLHIIRGIFNRLRGERLQTSSMVERILTETMNLLTHLNKEKMIQRVALVYNSAEETDKVNVFRFDIWPKLSQKEMELFDVPSHNISEHESLEDKEHSLPKYEQMTEGCTQVERDIKSELRSGNVVFDSGLISKLERCRPKEKKDFSKSGNIESLQSVSHKDKEESRYPMRKTEQSFNIEDKYKSPTKPTSPPEMPSEPKPPPATIPETAPPPEEPKPPPATIPETAPPPAEPKPPPATIPETALPSTTPEMPAEPKSPPATIPETALPPAEPKPSPAMPSEPAPPATTPAMPAEPAPPAMPSEPAPPVTTPAMKTEAAPPEMPAEPKPPPATTPAMTSEPAPPATTPEMKTEASPASLSSPAMPAESAPSSEISKTTTEPLPTSP